MSPKPPARPKPTRPKRSSAETGDGVLAGDEAWVESEAHEGSANEGSANEGSANEDGADADGEPPVDAAELDPQLERAEGEGMVTEHAKVSATDPGPEPLPEPEPEPEPDHGPGEPDDERD